MPPDRVPISKRTLDLVLLAAVAPIVVPVAAFVGLLVRVKLGSPVLFTQERPGLGGRPFRLRKFRTMTSPVGDPALDSDDVRLTPFGAALRRTSIDELPELWNVLVGEMSFVGPRPLLKEYLPLYTERQRTRHDVLPGLTGLAQVSGRNLVGWDERLELDAQYAETRSVRRDAAILARTLCVVLRREGISAQGHVTMTKFGGSGVPVEARKLTEEMQ